MIDDSHSDPDGNLNVNRNFILSNESEDNREHRKMSDNESFDFGIEAPTIGNLNNKKYNQNYFDIGINSDLVKTTTVYQLIFYSLFFDAKISSCSVKQTDIYAAQKRPVYLILNELT